MDADDGMLRLDGFATDELAVPSGVVGLREAAVLGAEALEEGFDGLRETVVGSCLGGPCCVSAGLGDGEQGQDGDAG